MRAIAVAAVVLYHAGVPGISGGYVGVDVFFVISGFLITRHLLSDVQRYGRVRMADFYARRVRRLFPAAFLVVGVTLLVGRLVLPFDRVSSLVRDALFSAGYALNYRLIAQSVDYQNAEAPHSPLQHFWSLAVEEQFYLVWPVIIGFCVLVGRRRGRAALIATMLVAAVAGSLYLSVELTGSQASLAYFSLQTRAWELGVGALVALAVPRLARLRPGLAQPLAWIGLVALLASVLVYDDTTPYPGLYAAVPVLGTALVIAAGVQRVERSPETALLDRGPMRYIGKVSYAWYLWHWPMLIVLPMWVEHSLTLVERLIVVFLAFWLAVLTYFLENAAMRSSWRPRSWLATGLVLSVAAVGASVLVGATSSQPVGTGAAQTVTRLATADISSVQRELGRSLAITKLPRNLAPSLSRALGDVPVAEKRGCFAQLLATVPTQCVFGDPKGTRTAVLLGDSHANQWMGPLSADAAGAHYRLIPLTKAACPAADLAVFSSDLKRPYRECQVWRAAVRKIVLRVKPDLIIASQSNSIPDTDIGPNAWVRDTLRGILPLAAKSTRLVYIGDTPTTARNTVECLGAHVDDGGKCAVARNGAFDVGYANYQSRYHAMRAQLPLHGIAYVDSLNFFCTYSYCPAVVGNMVVHRDNGHITNTYATWLAPMLSPIFGGQSR